MPEVEKFNDLTLTQKAQAFLLGIPRAGVTFVAVEKGVANLSGLARTSEVIEECERAVLGIKGITKVKNQMKKGIFA